MSIADHLAQLLQRDIQIAIEDVLHVEHGSAHVIAVAVFKKLQCSWGGQKVYIPAKDSIGRNQAIREAFNGRNHADICMQFNVSLSTLYRILK